MVEVPSRQIPGVYHRQIGDIVVTALSDGYLDGSVEVLQSITPDEATRMLTDGFRPGRRTSVNCYLVYSAGRLALIETGSGNYLLPTAGKLQQNLAAAGVDPASIEVVMLTHMHPDHSAGLADPKTGRKIWSFQGDDEINTSGSMNHTTSGNRYNDERLDVVTDHADHANQRSLADAVFAELADVGGADRARPREHLVGGEQAGNAEAEQGRQHDPQQDLPPPGPFHLQAARRPWAARPPCPRRTARSAR